VTQAILAGIIGVAGRSVDAPYDAVADAADGDLVADLTEAYGVDYVRFRLSAAVRYGTRTSSGRTELGYELQVALTKSLCRLRGGMFEDEVNGTHQMLRVGEEPTSNW
jgi:hypothetical protein